MITYLIHPARRTDDSVIHYSISRVFDRVRGKKCRVISHVACFCDKTAIGLSYNVHYDGCDYRQSSLDECKRFLSEHNGYVISPINHEFVRDEQIEFVECDFYYDDLEDVVYRGQVLPFKHIKNEI